MQFLLTARDYSDDGALERRKACRQAHVEMIDLMKAQGHMICGGAILNDDGHMVGSAIVCEFDSKEALQSLWLDREPYLSGRVWETVTIQPYQLGPSFTH